MKMLTATVTNATLTPEEFHYFRFYLHMAWPCERADGGITLKSVPADDRYPYPKGSAGTVSAEEFLRKNIRDVCVKALSHHGDHQNTEKSYHLYFTISNENDLGECGRFKPEKDVPYPLCDRPECMISEICGASAHLSEQAIYPGE